MQITILGTLAVVLLMGVLVGTSIAFHYRGPAWTSAVLTSEKPYLSEIAHHLALAYVENERVSGTKDSQENIANTSAADLRHTLISLAHATVQDTDGLYGGFYSRATANIVSSSEAPADNTKVPTQRLPPVERNEILAVARRAAENGVPFDGVIEINREYLLIDAVPIPGSSKAASAWVVRRLPVIPGGNRFRAYLLAAGLGAAALACVILTMLLVRNLQSGVRKIEAGLANLEGNLASRIPAESDPDEIRRIADAINRMGATLRENLERERLVEDRLRHSEKLAALGRLVAGVAHEVRNPLATIRLRVQMCQRKAENAEVFESCSIALDEIERLNEMVSRLLSFAQPVRLHEETSNLCRLAEQRLDLFREKAARAGIRFITNLGDEESLLPVDRGRMAQVFDNAIQNAIDAMADSGGILRVIALSGVKTSKGSEATGVEFSDTGTGMAPEILNRIFDPFFTTKDSGTGLGLSICHELVRAHGGEIHVESIEGRGTSVRILIPNRHAEVTNLA